MHICVIYTTYICIYSTYIYIYVKAKAYYSKQRTIETGKKALGTFLRNKMRVLMFSQFWYSVEFICLRPVTLWDTLSREACLSLSSGHLWKAGRKSISCYVTHYGNRG